MQNVFEGDNRLVELADYGPRLYEDDPVDRFVVVGEAAPYERASEWF
jgi:hypothetical protein